MSLGSNTALEQFPRLLQLVEYYPETTDQFIKKVLLNTQLHSYNYCVITYIHLLVLHLLEALFFKFSAFWGGKVKLLFNIPLDLQISFKRCCNYRKCHY